MIRHDQPATVFGIDRRTARACPMSAAGEAAGEAGITPGTLVMTPDGELGEATHTAFGMVAVRLSAVGRIGCPATTYHAVADLTPVLCPADAVTPNELAGLHGIAIADAA
jgi:hypothetical protein